MVVRCVRRKIAKLLLLICNSDLELSITGTVRLPFLCSHISNHSRKSYPDSAGSVGVNSSEGEPCSPKHTDVFELGVPFAQLQISLLSGLCVALPVDGRHSPREMLLEAEVGLSLSGQLKCSLDLCSVIFIFAIVVIVG